MGPACFNGPCQAGHDGDGLLPGVVANLLALFRQDGFACLQVWLVVGVEWSGVAVVVWSLLRSMRERTVFRVWWTTVVDEVVRRKGGEAEERGRGGEWTTLGALVRWRRDGIGKRTFFVLGGGAGGERRRRRKRCEKEDEETKGRRKLCSLDVTCTWKLSTATLSGRYGERVTKYFTRAVSKQMHGRIVMDQVQSGLW